jgi:SPP1 gp7 family putative phage head morphogenesis protein
MTANAALYDRAVDHEIDLIRFERGVVFRMIAVLNRSDAQLTAQLSEALLQIDVGSFTVERLDSLLSSVRQTNAAAYAAVFDEFGPELQALAKAEADAQAAGLRSAVPAAVQLRFPVAAVAWEQVYAAAVSRPFQGRLLRDWAATVPEQRMAAIRNAIRAGFVEGQTTADIIKRVRGTKALRYEDGILARPRRELASVIQTALSHTAQTARSASYAANADLVKAIRWVSTLDNRTSPMCRVRDGLLYSADTKHKPLGHKVPWGDGPGRLHFNCRSVSIPVLKSWRELGIPAEEMPAGTRASMDGQVSAETTYGQWLSRQSAARQDEILGPERGALLRAGKVTVEQFSDDKGNWLTLAQLLARIG